MKTTQLKIEFLREKRAKVWLFLNVGGGKYIAVPDTRDERELDSWRAPGASTPLLPPMKPRRNGVGRMPAVRHR